MKCVYCQNNMLFNAVIDTFVCSDCKATLKIMQHPELMTHSNMIKYDTDLGSDEKPEHMKSYNNDGISTQWNRGNK